MIAYIGETKFAPGDWAGVVLDEPIGKDIVTIVVNRKNQKSRSNFVDFERNRFSKLKTLYLQRIFLINYQDCLDHTITKVPLIANESSN